MKKILSITMATLLAAASAYAENATLELGNFSTATDYLEGGTPEERGFPFNYQYVYSGGQIIYPYAVVKDIADRNGEITSISFRYSENGTFYDGNFEGTSSIWAQATDLQSTQMNDKNESIWQAYASGSKATTSIDYELTYDVNIFEVKYTFANPIKLAPGQSLLITASSEVTNSTFCYSDDFYCYAFRVGTGTERYATYYGNDTKSFETNCLPDGAYSRNSQWAPVAKIEYSYVDKLPQAATPTFSPESGSALGPNDKVTITAEEGATILYTLENDGTPNLTYTEPIAIDNACTITAIATREGYDPSEAASASYTLKVTAAPTFSPVSGTALGPDDKVTITADEGATILYTLEKDGTPNLTYTEPIAIDKACTITAIASCEGYYTGEAASASYTLKTTSTPDFITPETALLGANETVIISAAEGASILYTLDAEATPDMEYPAEGISLPAGTSTIRAIATLPGAYASREIEGTFTVSDLNAMIIGDYNALPNSDNTFIGTNWYNAPVIPTYANSASQMLYQDYEMPGRTDKTRLRAISFRFYNETCFAEYASTARIYLSIPETDAFPYDVKNEKYIWFDVILDEPAATVDWEVNFLDYYCGTGELIFTLGEDGFDIPANKPLLITVVNEAATPLDNGEYPQFFKYSTNDRRTASFASDHTTFAASLDYSEYIENGDDFYSFMTDNNQPCVKLFTDELGKGESHVAGILSGTSKATEYYTIQGVRLSHTPTEPGIYIRRSAEGTQKIYVR